MMKIKCLLLFQLIFFVCFAQNERSIYSEIEKQTGVADSLISAKLTDIPKKYYRVVERKATNVTHGIEVKSGKLIREYMQFEGSIKKKLMKRDSVGTHEFFENSGNQFRELIKIIQSPAEKFQNNNNGEYLPYLDSLKCSLDFLNDLSKLQGKEINGIKSRFDQIAELQASFEKAKIVKECMQKRQDQLKSLLSKYSSIPRGITKRVSEMNQKVLSYSYQIKAYKELFRNPEGIELKVLAVLNEIPAFKQFAKKNTMLANLFPGGSAPAPNGKVIGLQSRDEMQSMMVSKMRLKAPEVSSLVQKNTQSAQGQLDQLREDLKILGQEDGNLTMPDFKPDLKKSASFKDRLEFGINIQNTKSNYFFPQTVDLGLSLGYSLGENSIVGVGISYKIGLGENLRKISVTSEGLSLRSFMDWKIKKTYFLTGGFEYNYQQAFYSFQSVLTAQDWQTSGLLGLTKTFSLGAKGIRKTKIQLLWDFLSYQQVPRTEPLKFRIGYFF